MEVFENLKANLVGKNARIVLPEGEEPRILQATKRIVNETEVTPVLLGNPDKIRIYLEIEGVLDGYEVIDPHSYPGFEEMVASLVERRKGKMTEEEARQVLKDDVNYFGVMLVHMGIVDGIWCDSLNSRNCSSGSSNYQNSSKCQTDFWCLPYGTWIRTLLVRGLCHQH